MVGEHARMQRRAVRLDPAAARRCGARSARCARRRARCSLRRAPRESVRPARSNLSYGDQRRVEIARALASDPKLLLLDEPTAGMNPQESARLTEFMEKLRDERDLTILLIEHDMKVVMGVSEHITVLDHGDEDRRGRARRRSAPTSA